MYYIFATIALVLALCNLNNKNTKGISIASIIIVAITFVIKMVNTLVLAGNIPEWLTNGMI